jgi:hypothetical protein
VSHLWLFRHMTDDLLPVAGKAGDTANKSVDSASGVAKKGASSASGAVNKATDSAGGAVNKTAESATGSVNKGVSGATGMSVPRMTFGGDPNDIAQLLPAWLTARWRAADCKSDTG